MPKLKLRRSVCTKEEELHYNYVGNQRGEHHNEAVVKIRRRCAIEIAATNGAIRSLFAVRIARNVWTMRDVPFLAVATKSLVCF